MVFMLSKKKACHTTRVKFFGICYEIVNDYARKPRNKDHAGLLERLFDSEFEFDRFHRFIVL